MERWLRPLHIHALTLLLGMSCGAFAANEAAQTFTLDGQLFQAGTTTALLDSGAQLKIQILNPAKTCILYEETQTVSTSSTNGFFTVQVGSAVGSAKRTASDPGTAMAAIFQNVAPITGVAVPGQTCTGSAYTPTAGDVRYFRVTVIPSATSVADVLSPDMVVDSVPTALVAQSVQGLDRSSILQVQNDASTVLTQSNAANIFSTTNYPELVALLGGTSTRYISSSPSTAPNFNGQRLTNLADPTAAQDAVTKTYADSFMGGKTVDVSGVGAGVGNGKTLMWDSTLNKWYAANTGSVSYIGSGSGLTGGPITSTGTLAVDVGTTANKIVQLNTAGLLPAVDGSLLTNVNASKLGTRSVASTAPGVGEILGWNNTTAQWEPQVNAGITALTGDVTATGPGSAAATIANNAVTSAKINNTGNVINRLLITDGTTGANVTYATCGLGEVLSWTATGWLCTSVNTFLGTSGATAGTYGSDTMVAKTTVDTQGRVTAITNVNIAFPVTSVAGRTGAVTLVAADIGGLGTAALKDYGTAAGNLVELNGSAGLPAVNGSLLTNVNAVQIQSRDIAATAPGAGQVLGWNNTASRWEPISVTNGTLTSVTGGLGINGGTITSIGTLSVDVGVTANKIMQVTSTGQIPAIDGNLITNINAVKLQSRDVAATAPNGGEVLSWNSSSAAWEPRAVTSGTVTSVTGGIGTTGGTITSTGTITVDVGTSANQIVQMTSTGVLPGVDGSLLTNLNASRIGTRTIATTAPNAGEFVGWNTSTSQWEPMAVTTGTVTNVATGLGLLGGPISSTGTLSVDVGVTANKIMQVTSTGQIPAIDGNLISNINAVKLQARDVAATAPNGGEVLSWNSSLSVWEPRAVTSGTLTSVTGGVGTTGGTITSTGTITVDVGTSANQIVQLTSTGVLPGVDGYLLTNLNATRIGTRTIATTAPNAGEFVGWNTSTSQWEPMAVTTGTVTNVATGLGLLGGPISSTGTLSVDVGVTANKIMQVTSTGQIPAIDGNLITNINAVKLQARDVAATAPNGGEVLSWNSSTSAWEPRAVTSGTLTSVTGGVGTTGGTITSSGTITVDVGTSANQIVQMTSTGVLPGVDGSLLTNLNASRIGTRTIATTAPNAGEFVGWNTSTSQWEPMAVTTGTVTNVATGLGLLGGPISSTGTLSVDVGVTANKIMQVTSTGQIPAIDGNLITNINAVKLQSRDVATTAPNGGQVLGWNSSTSLWEPMSAAVGSVTNVMTGTGMLGGPISSSGTLSVDVGVTANKIVQMTSTGVLPGVDGYLLTNLNASRIGTRAIATTAPNAGEFVGWNTSTSQWEPMAVTTGTVINVASGVGLLGGPISSTGTLSVDVGVTANKIMQVTSTGQIPAIDGNLVTNINAVKLQARDVAATAPNGGEVLSWNSSTAAWEPRAVTSGTLTSVTGGVGTTGGTITSTGTITVDVGTTANKIVQMTPSGVLPGVDGSLLTNLNATRIGTFPIATTTPTAGTYVGWNTTTAQWEPMAAGVGSVTSVTGGTGLTGGSITGAGTLAVDVGTTANKIVQLTPAGVLPSVDGSLLTNLNATRIGTRSVASTAPSSGQVLGWNSTTSTWEPVSSSATGFVNGGNTFGANSSLGNQDNYTLSLLTNNTTRMTINTAGLVGIGTTTPTYSLDVNGTFQAVTSVTSPTYTAARGVTLTVTAAIGTTPSSNGSALLLKAGNGGGTSGDAGAVTVQGGVATNGNGGSALITATAGVGTNKDGGNLVLTAGASTGTGIAGTLQLLGGNVGIGTTSPTLGTRLDITGTGATASSIIIPRDTVANRPTTGVNGMIRYASDTDKFEVYEGGAWKNMVGSGAFISSLTASTGLTGGVITSTGTIAVDVGTSANKIVQMTPAGLLPAVDGNLLTNLNATRIGTFPIATTTPTAGTFVGWNTTTAQWEPMATTTGTVTSITATTGLTGGTITSGGTIAVDVGTSANKIVQMTSTGVLPAVDGYLLTNLNASRIGTRSVASTAPTSGQVLGWNSTTSTWEPISSSATGFVNGGNTFGGDSTLGNQDNFKLSFLTNNTSRMTIDTSGYVGIGTAAPAGVLDVRGGTAAASTAGTAINLIAQAAGAGATNNGGSINLTSGTGAGNGLGGAITLTGGQASGTGVGGALNLTGGQAASAVGGPVSLLGGMSSSQSGGPVNITGGWGGFLGGSGNGGQVTIQGGKGGFSGSTNGNGGAVAIMGGIPQNSGSGGSISLISADGVGTNQNGGNVVIAAGAQTGTGTAGTIQFTIGNVGIGTTSPTLGSKLDITGTGATASSIIIPRDTVANRPVTGVNGMIRYASDTDKFEVYEGGSWKNMVGSGAFISSLTASTGLTGGTVTSTGTIAVDVGTTANKIVQMTPAGILPGVDGSLLTNLNATRIGTFPIATTTPTAGKFVGWNTTTSQWEPMAAGVGSVTNVTGGTGLTGGSITGAGTLAVDVGTTANKIVQLTPAGVLPALDGSLISNLNATRMGTRPVASTAPAAGQVMGWNNTTSTWEPTTVGALAFNNGGNAFGANSTLGNTDNFNLSFLTNNSARMTVTNAGNVGVGTTTPRMALDVAGAIGSNPAVNVTTTTVDFATSNLAYTTQDCQSFALWNMKDGATYSFAVQSTNAATCSFTAFSGSGSGALTVKLPLGHAATSAGKQTFYTFVVMGTTVYVAWVPGY